MIFEVRGRREYFGGVSDARAARTVFRAIPRSLAMVLMPSPSARCNRRIAAQFSTVINLHSAPKGVKIQMVLRGQFSTGADRNDSMEDLTDWSGNCPVSLKVTQSHYR
jgi:hypothetical protein